MHQKPLELPFKCQSCDKAFILEEALHYHQKMEHDYIIDSFECKYCFRKFFCKGSYQVHVRLFHEGSQNDLHLCEFCSDYANNVLDLVRHYKDCHELEKLPYFHCTDCDYFSKDIVETRQHRITEHKMEGEQKKCISVLVCMYLKNICKRWYRSALF